jgi:hypothetical protein
VPRNIRRNEDAERDCTTVLGLSKTNVKALYRRAQARIALQKLGEAHNGAQLLPKNTPFYPRSASKFN